MSDDGADRVSGERLTSFPPDTLVGQNLAGRYDVLELIKEGGMGRVYRGVQRFLDRPVAIKCIHPHLVESEAVVERFLEEAKVASKLQHPNIVQIYDFGWAQLSDGGRFFLVMELLSGTSLAEEISTGRPFPLLRIGSIIVQVLSALGEAHAHTVTHRDAKPDNIILQRARDGSDRIKLIDFGIAKSQGRRKLTATGQFLGTPNYMAPEQILGHDVQGGADLYAVGSILFELLTAKALFDDDSVDKILQQQLGAPRPDPRSVAPERSIPDEIAEICLKAIDLDPAKRFQTAEEFADAVHAVLPVAESGRVSNVPHVSKRPQPPTSAAPTPPSASIPVKIQSEPLQIAPSIASPAPSSTPPQSHRYRWSVANIGFEDFQELEHRSAEALKKGNVDVAVDLLKEGIDLARSVLRAGDSELGTAAWTSFARRLGGLLRQAGRYAESRDVLSDVLKSTKPDDRALALTLEQLTLTLRASGLDRHAEQARERALQAAKKTGDNALVQRLRASRTEPAMPKASVESKPPDSPSKSAQFPKSDAPGGEPAPPRRRER